MTDATRQPVVIVLVRYMAADTPADRDALHALMTIPGCRGFLVLASDAAATAAVDRALTEEDV